MFFEETLIKLGLKNAYQLSQINKKLLYFSFQIENGHYSNPFTANNRYHILNVINRIEAKEQPLIDVRDVVIKKYIQDSSSILFNKISTTLLENITINDEALNSYITANKSL